MWSVIFSDDFAPEFRELPRPVKTELLAAATSLRQFGPQLSRPHADTLKDSKFANMKELRFNADGGVWRVAFAFDPRRNAILLIAGDKSGGSQMRFYREFIRKADERFDKHLRRLNEDET